MTSTSQAKVATIIHYKYYSGSPQKYKFIVEFSDGAVRKFVQYGNRSDGIKDTVNQIKRQFEGYIVRVSRRKVRSVVINTPTIVAGSDGNIRILFECKNDIDNFTIPCPCATPEEAHKYLIDYKKTNPTAVEEFKYRYEHPNSGFESLVGIVELID